MLSYKLCKNCGDGYDRKGNAQKYCLGCKIVMRKKRQPKYRNTYYLNNKEALLDRHHEYQRSDKGKEVAKKTFKNMKSKYPDKFKARYALNDAVKAGKIIKPDMCEMCRKQLKLHGHHHDYSKALEVKWLCQSCHVLIHRPLSELIEACGKDFGELFADWPNQWWVAHHFNYGFGNDVMGEGSAPEEAVASLLLTLLGRKV